MGSTTKNYTISEAKGFNAYPATRKSTYWIMGSFLVLEALVYIAVHTCVVDISIDHVLTVVSIVLVPFKVTSRLHK